jgi:hypothetical protein
MDCGVDTGYGPGGNGHYYGVHDHVWLQAVPTRHGQLCLHCLKKRLGRPLTDDDFDLTPRELYLNLFHPPDALTGEELDELWRIQVEEGIKAADAAEAAIRKTRGKSP